MAIPLQTWEAHAPRKAPYSFDARSPPTRSVTGAGGARPAWAAARPSSALRRCQLEKAAAAPTLCPRH